jgi:hypothetical protein
MFALISIILFNYVIFLHKKSQRTSEIFVAHMALTNVGNPSLFLIPFMRKKYTPPDEDLVSLQTPETFQSFYLRSSDLSLWFYNFFFFCMRFCKILTFSHLATFLVFGHFSFWHRCIVR